MDNSIRKAKENKFQSEYKHLMEEAREERKLEEDRRRYELFNENPLDENYARWAITEDIKETLTPITIGDKTYAASGIPLLCQDSTAYVDTSDSHSLIIGSSGSKKTRLIIMPSIYTLAQAGESMVITDPKSELFEKTSGYLKEKGYKVYCLSFRDEERKNSWNPLKIPMSFYKMGKLDLSIGLLNDFAHISIPKDSSLADPFWDDSARSSFMGLFLILMMIADNEKQVNIKSFLKIKDALLNRDFSTRENFYKLRDFIDKNSMAYYYLSSIFNAPEKTFGCIVTTLDTHLMKYIIRPEITDMLCHNDIDFSELGNGKTAIFVVMPDEKETYHGLVSVFIQQCYEYLIFDAQHNKNKMLKNRVNFLLDEFASLPKIESFPSMIAAARSRNIRFNLVVQSEKQLYTHYMEASEIIEGNCNNWIYLYSKEINTLNKISELCGVQKNKEPLVTTSKLQRLNKEEGEAIVFHAREFPYRSHLTDIDDYGLGKNLPIYFETPQIEKTDVFDYEYFMKTKSDTCKRNRFSGKKNDEKNSFEKYYEIWKSIERLNNKEPLKDNFFFDLNKTSSENRGICDENLYDKFSLKVNLDNETREIANKVPFNIIYSLPDFISENIFIKSENIENTFKIMANRVSESGLCVPIIFDMKKLKSKYSWDFRAREDGLPALTAILANELLTLTLDKNFISDDGTIDIELEKYAKKLDDEFKNPNINRPDFLVMLYNLDAADSVFDSLWQSWKIGSYSNVQLIAAGNKTDLVEKNCSNFIIKKQEAISPAKLIFSDETCEIEIKQEKAPSIIIEKV